jgi:hypothetical protein
MAAWAPVPPTDVSRVAIIVNVRPGPGTAITTKD